MAYGGMPHAHQHFQLTLNYKARTGPGVLQIAHLARGDRSTAYRDITSGSTVLTHVRVMQPENSGSLHLIHSKKQ